MDKNNFLKALALVIFSLGGIISATLVSNYFKTPEPTPEMRRSIVECPTTVEDYRIASQKAQTAPLISSKVFTHGENGAFINQQVVITKSETEKSKIACGYIRVKAGTKTHGGLLSYENLYIKPGNFGGHINRDGSFGPGDGTENSDYIFSLNKIQYWRSRDDRSIRNADWASLLNVSNEVPFEIGLNTTDTSGFVEEVSITYKCWDPKTGKENTECKIEASSPIPKEVKSL